MTQIAENSPSVGCPPTREEPSQRPKGSAWEWFPPSGNGGGLWASSQRNPYFSLSIYRYSVEERREHVHLQTIGTGQEVCYKASVNDADMSMSGPLRLSIDEVEKDANRMVDAIKEFRSGEAIEGASHRAAADHSRPPWGSRVE